MELLPALSEKAYILMANVEYGGRTLAAGSVGSADGFGSLFKTLRDSGLLNEFDPEADWPEVREVSLVDMSPVPLREARAILELLEGGGNPDREELSRHARRLLFSLSANDGETAGSPKVSAAVGPWKTLREVPSAS